MPIVAYIIFGLIAITVIVMLVINFMYHNVKKWREAAEERYYRNLKRKEQKEKNPFGDDYFKSSKKQQTKYAQQQYTQSARKTSNAQTAGNAQTASNTAQAKPSTEEETTARKTTTSDGVTIIDDRTEEKKIFDHGDGEYVEFEEV